MTEELKYRISFTKGSLEGQLFPLGAESVIVGRSHTCGIRLMEPDVSGRHVMLTVGPKGVEMEVISSRRTALDGRGLKTGDRVAVRAGQSVAMGGIATFTVECYRNEGDMTEAPGDWTDGATRLGGDAGDDTTRRPESGHAPDATSMTTPAAGFGGTGDDEDTGTHIPPPPPPRANHLPPPKPRSGVFRSRSDAGLTQTGTVGTLAVPPPRPPAGGETLGTEAIQVPADATQVLQTRAATPQELAYMRELHNKKQRRRVGVRLVLGGLLTALAGGMYVWMSIHAPEQTLSIPDERTTWHLLDSDLQPILDGEPSGGGTMFFWYPDQAGTAEECPVEARTNAALGVVENVFTVKTHIGREMDVPLRLQLVAYASEASLQQAQTNSFADWDRTNGMGLEKQSPMPTDFVGVNPGVPFLRYTYTRKATEEEEAEGVLNWSGVLSFGRFRDTCLVLFREVPSVEALRAEYLLQDTEVFFSISDSLVLERWAGLPQERQFSGRPDVLRNSAKELLEKKMGNEWEELEAKLTTLMIRTYPVRDREPEAAQQYGEAVEWMKILRVRQDETWKERSAKRYQVSLDPQAEPREMDEDIKALFRSRDDRRYDLAQKEKWWLE